MLQNLSGFNWAAKAKQRAEERSAPEAKADFCSAEKR